MSNNFYIAIPAYNEEKTIGPCLISVAKAVKSAIFQFNLEATYICLNGFTDNTEKVVKHYIKKVPQLKINIMFSTKGMNRALNTIINLLPNNSYPIIKLDADTMVDKMSFLILLNELNKHPTLQIVGGHPIALTYKGKNPFKKLLSNVLDVRSRWPQAQIAVHDVSRFHTLADVDPQPNITIDFEKRSRIYFHGRFYVMRNKNIWNVPPEQIGDDTYLTLSVYKRFGSNSIRIRYDAICYYYPTTSLYCHWKTYKRIYYDVKMTFNLPEFKEMKDFKHLAKVKLNWSYIKTLPIKIIFYFICYAIIKRLEELLFKVFPKYSERLWTYKKKIN